MLTFLEWFLLLNYEKVFGTQKQPNFLQIYLKKLGTHYFPNEILALVFLTPVPARKKKGSTFSALERDQDVQSENRRLILYLLHFSQLLTSRV